MNANKTLSALALTALLLCSACSGPVESSSSDWLQDATPQTSSSVISPLDQ